VLADFGLARHIDTERSSSLERFSYRHAAPQVLYGELPTVADDAHSLGSTLFTLLDGRPPFAVDDPGSDTALAYLRRVRTESPRPLRSPDVPAELRAIIERCLAKRREDRFPDAASLRDALAAVVTEARRWAPARTIAHATRAATPAAPATPRAPVATTEPPPPALSPAPAPDPPDLPGPAPTPPAWSAVVHLDPWRVDPSLLGRPFSGRTALLSPLDRLVYDRRRTLELFGLDYQLEMYKPAAVLAGTRPLGRRLSGTRAA
jgi:serine/threonine protein kinase